MTEHPMPALMLAAQLAAQMRGHTEGCPQAWSTILRGAPTHSGAFLLNALAELGWELVPVQRGLDRTIAIDALREIAAHATVERNPDGVDQAAETMQLIAENALIGIGALPAPSASTSDRGT